MSNNIWEVIIAIDNSRFTSEGEAVIEEKVYLIAAKTAIDALAQVNGINKYMFDNATNVKVSLFFDMIGGQVYKCIE